MNIDNLIVACILIILVLLVLLYMEKPPERIEGESDSAYQAKLHDHQCVVKGNRNTLIAGLVLALGAYWYRVIKVKKHDILKYMLADFEVQGGAVEAMGEDETEYYRGDDSGAVSDMSDDDNY